MKKILKMVFGVLIIVIFIGTIVFLYNRSKSKPVIYETETPFVSNIVKKTVATGSIVPRKEIEIKPQVSGIIQEIYVEPGNKIKTGDLIAKVKVIPNMINLNNAENRLNRAKISFADSEKIYKRQKQLFADEVIAEGEFQQYELSFLNSKEELDAAENNFQIIKEGVSKKADQSTNTLVRSTIDGTILDVPVEEGNSVIESNTFNAGTTIATIANLGEMIFKGNVDEAEVGKLNENMPLLLTVGALEDAKFEAKLEYISPKGVIENGAVQFEIKAKVNLQDTLFIRAGYSANADIVLEKKDSILVIHESLLNFRKNSDSAFVEIETEAQKFEERDVILGISDGINIEIISGLNEKTKIKIPKL
ncbi:MAG: efflux RND transporter periplasmic adaptor subunit [Bacteroidetes bacterium]|nr:efflux RND transporter periplasmic adaptor subunit [Bacteroidota bacterium]